jgi:hypothetical protein
MDARSAGAGLDGNALAGPLTEVFMPEVTTAQAQCAGCGRVSAVAELAVYGPEPGFVARCPGCASVLLRLVRASTEAWLDLSGMSVLRMSVPAQ